MMIPETLITMTTIGLAMMGILLLFSGGIFFEDEKEKILKNANNEMTIKEKLSLGDFRTCFAIIALGLFCLFFSIYGMESTYQSVLNYSENNLAFYYTGAEYLDSKPNGDEGYFHYFETEIGEVYIYESFKKYYDEDSLYLLCMSDMGSHDNIYDDEIMTIWEGRT